MDYLKVFEENCDNIIQLKKIVRPENISDGEWQLLRAKEVSQMQLIVAGLMNKKSLGIKQKALAEGINISKDLDIIRDRKVREYISNNLK